MKLGERMKEYYESRNQIHLIRKIPVIMRLDGRAFHTFTKIFNKPFDNDFSCMMIKTALDLCGEIQGVKCAYIQSDEISLLITDLDRIETQSWFEYNVQKMCSVSSSIATISFGAAFIEWNIGINIETYDLKKIGFDSRVFNIPKEEVENYFIWRQKDWERNSIQMLAQAHFSHKELYKKNKADMHEMLFQKGINWADLLDKWKNGVFIIQDIDGYKIMNKCPIFTEDNSRLMIRLLLETKDNIQEEFKK